MVEVKLYSSTEKVEWDDFVIKSKTPLFFFKRDYLEYHSERFHDCSLMFYQNDVLVSIFPATRDMNTLISHGGLTFGGVLVTNKTRVATVVEVFDELLEFSKSQAISKIIYKPSPTPFHQYPCEEDLYCIKNTLNGVLYKRDLSSVIKLSERIKLSKGRKALISRARKLGLVVEDSNDWEGFHTLLSSILEKHSATAVHSASELEYLTKQFPRNIKLKVIKVDEEIISAVLFFLFEGVTHTQYMATNEKGRECGALDFIIETAIQQSHEEGVEYFSFGISTENNGTVLNGGLAAQKESFGARAICIDSYEVEVK
jgi:hypothetical protein